MNMNEEQDQEKSKPLTEEVLPHSCCPQQFNEAVYLLKDMTERFYASGYHPQGGDESRAIRKAMKFISMNVKLH